MNRPPERPPDLGRLLVDRSPAVANWVRLWDETLARLTAKVGKEELTLSEALNRMSDPQAKVRKAAAQALAGALEERTPVLGLVLNTAAFEKQVEDRWRRLTADRITPLDTMLDSRGRHTLFCGEGAGRHIVAISEALGSKAHIIEGPAPLSRLQGVAMLGGIRLDSGDGDAVAALAPRYLRSPGITRPAAPTRVRKGG